MNVKEAVAKAKGYITALLEEENIINLGVEEVEFSDFDGEGLWRITVGFSRPWNQTTIAALSTGGMQRSYKIVSLSDKDGNVLSMKDWKISKEL